MGTIYDYVKKYGDVSFKDKEFNGIVLEAFKYLDFNKIELDKLQEEFKW